MLLDEQSPVCFHKVTRVSEVTVEVAVKLLPEANISSSALLLMLSLEPPCPNITPLKFYLCTQLCDRNQEQLFLDQHKMNNGRMLISLHLFVSTNEWICTGVLDS